MQKRSIWMLPLALFAALALVLGACGSDGDSDVAADDPSTDEGDTSSESDSDSGDSDAVDDAASDIIGEQLGGDCAFLGEFAGDFESGFAGAFDPSAALSGGTTDLGDLYGPLADQFADVADDAPEEIAGAFATLADAFGQAADALEGVSLDFSDPANIDPEAIAQFESLGEVFNEEVEQASTDISEFFATECNIDVDG